MELQKFIQNFAEQFEETERSEFAADTEFKALEEWDSLLALTIIAMVDEEYDVKIEGTDIRGAETIQDLFETVKSKA